MSGRTIWMKRGASPVPAIATQLRVAADADVLFSIVQGQPVSFERIGVLESAPFLLALLGLGSFLALLPALELAVCSPAIAIARQAESLQEGPTAAYVVGLGLCSALAIGGVVHVVASVALVRVPALARWRFILLIAGIPSGPLLVWFLLANGLYWTPR